MGTVATAPRPSESGHWYAKDGTPVYEVMGSNGKIRPATLRDARKMGLLPGFSSIKAMEAQPQLERWKVNQALLAALTLPRLPGETDDAFIERAREDSFEQARKAAERGTEVHAAIQSSFSGFAVGVEFLPYLEAVRNHIAMNFGSCDGWETEVSFAHPLGYGGKADLKRTDAVLDLKGKDFDKETLAEKGPLAWPEHCMQLAAYREGLGIPTARCANIFFSRKVPGLVVVHEWTQEELATGWEAFQLLCRLWQLRRAYFCSFSKEAA